MKEYSDYIATNNTGTLYVGIGLIESMNPGWLDLSIDASAHSTLRQAQGINLGSGSRGRLSMTGKKSAYQEGVTEVESRKAV